MHAKIMRRNYLTKNSTLIRFLELPQIDKVFNEHKVIMVFLGGSTAVGLDNEHSDYDVNFLVADNCKYYNSASDGLMFCVDGIVIHFYIISRSAIYNSYRSFSAFLIKLSA